LGSKKLEKLRNTNCRILTHHRSSTQQITFKLPPQLRIQAA
jgi:hypothetical protein